MKAVFIRRALPLNSNINLNSAPPHARDSRRTIWRRHRCALS